MRPLALTRNEKYLNEQFRRNGGRWLTPSQAANYFGVPATQLLSLNKRGCSIRKHGQGKSEMVSYDDLEASVHLVRAPQSCDELALPLTVSEPPAPLTYRLPPLKVAPMTTPQPPDPGEELVSIQGASWILNLSGAETRKLLEDENLQTFEGRWRRVDVVALAELLKEPAPPVVPEDVPAEVPVTPPPALPEPPVSSPQLPPAQKEDVMQKEEWLLFTEACETAEISTASLTKYADLGLIDVLVAKDAPKKYRTADLLAVRDFIREHGKTPTSKPTEEHFAPLLEARCWGKKRSKMQDPSSKTTKPPRTPATYPNTPEKPVPQTTIQRLTNLTPEEFKKFDFPMDFAMKFMRESTAAETLGITLERLNELKEHDRVKFLTLQGSVPLVLIEIESVAHEKHAWDWLEDTREVQFAVTDEWRSLVKALAEKFSIPEEEPERVAWLLMKAARHCCKS